MMTFNGGNCECNNNICDGVENNTAIPNEAGCEYFFLCIDGRPIPNTCPPGQWFNYNIRLNILTYWSFIRNEKFTIPFLFSLFLHLSQCDNSTSPCEDAFECPPDGIHFFPHDDYCNKFIMCFAGYYFDEFIYLRGDCLMLIGKIEFP